MDKQIEEMAKDLGIAFQLAGTTRFGEVAEVLVNAGYRKASDVAREILTEISSYCDAKLNEASDKANNAFLKYDNVEIRIWLNRKRAYEDMASKLTELKKKFKTGKARARDEKNPYCI